MLLKTETQLNCSEARGVKEKLMEGKVSGSTGGDHRGLDGD